MVLAAAICALAMGCDDGSPADDAGPRADGGDRDAGSASGTDAGAGCDGLRGFEGTGTPFAVPDGIPVGVLTDASGSGGWITLRVDADGWVDLLRADPGQLAWRIYRGGPSGFDATGTAWSIPAAFPASAVIDVSGDARWLTARVDADDTLDALVADPGALSWRLHRGGAAGFDETGATFAIPARLPVDTLVDRSGGGQWILIDADGDGALDVLIADPASLAWRLHRGGASGFDAAGQSWSIPSALPSDAVLDRSGGGLFLVSDVDGDGVLDALVADPGNLAWALYRGGASGFAATPTPWTIPDVISPNSVVDRIGAGWITVDADGDGTLDLLRPDPGALAWRLHRGSASGFDPAGTPVAVPDGIPVDAVFDRSGASWVVRDVDGDGRLDLWRADPGNLTWRLHRGECGG